MTMKSSSAVLPILKMLTYMAVIIAAIMATPVTPLLLTAGAAVQILYKTLMILPLKISTGMTKNPCLELRRVMQTTLTKPQLIPFTLRAEAILTLANQ